MASNVARVIPLRREERAEGEGNVVAVVLGDGTVRRLDGPGGDESSDWQNGQITGEDWVLWWQRRSFGSR